MIRSLIIWFAKRWLAKYLSAALAGQIVDAASAALDEIKEKGVDCVTCGDGEIRTPRFTIRPHDPGAIPVTLEDIYRGTQS